MHIFNHSITCATALLMEEKKKEHSFGWSNDNGSIGRIDTVTGSSNCITSTTLKTTKISYQLFLKNLNKCLSFKQQTIRIHCFIRTDIYLDYKYRRLSQS